MSRFIVTTDNMPNCMYIILDTKEDRPVPCDTHIYQNGEVNNLFLIVQAWSCLWIDD